MLVRLYDLPDLSPLVAQLKAQGVEIRRVMPPEKGVVSQWVHETFGFAGWRHECERGIMNTPPSCFLAVEGGNLIGFSCYDATCRNFFGPLGVHPSQRKRGLGKALLWVTLRAMQDAGYSYAIVPWVSSQEFYAKAVGAIPIPDSEPGFFKGMLKV